MAVEISIQYVYLLDKKANGKPKIYLYHKIQTTDLPQPLNESEELVLII